MQNQTFAARLRQKINDAFTNRVNVMSETSRSILFPDGAVAFPAVVGTAIGIKEFTEFTDFIVSGINLADKQLSDGFQFVQDVPASLGLLPKAITGLNGFKLIGAEILDMDENEAEQFKASFKKLDLINDRSEAVIEVIAEKVVDTWLNFLELQEVIRWGKGLQKAD